MENNTVQTKTPQSLYLDLMKKTLSYSLWPEPLTPIRSFAHVKKHTRFKKYLYEVASKLLRNSNFEIAESKTITAEDRMEGRGWPAHADTMVGIKRLDNIQKCIETIIKEQVPGDFMETGVWRGGASIFMKAVLSVYGITDRKIIGADSFEGLPIPDGEKYAADHNDKHHTKKFLAVSLEEVKANFEKYGLLDEQVVFLKGWFKDTLPTAPVDKLSLLRLDGDMYESTIIGFEHLYPKLSPGGYCIIDDYALSGCKKAVDDYRKKHNISTKYHVIDWTGIYWRKE